MKPLKGSCQFAYNNLDELDDLIRVYAESKLKLNREGDIEFQIACEAIEAISVAKGQIMVFLTGLGDEK